MKTINDIRSGDRFGDLIVGRETVREGSRLRYWLCRCVCGRQKAIKGTNLTSGMTKSCGCGIGKATKRVHTRHGSYKTKEYQIWATMKDRCFNSNNKKFHLYGGRGITVCDRWRHSFENFIADMGVRPTSRHSIDRIDGNGNYEPTNCRWATYKEQGNNTRANHLLSFRSLTLTVTQWAEHLNVNKKTLDFRLRSGWSVEKVLSEPVRKRRPNRA
jgi:hypothetical protein